MIIALQTLIFFRQSLLSVLDRLLSPYYKRLSLTFSRQTESEDEEEEQVFAEWDDEKGVVFFPPVYAQRYAAVSDCLMDERWSGKLEKVVDLGHHDMSFIKYLKEVPGVRCIFGVDIEVLPLRCSSDLMGCDDYGPKRESPLQVTLFQGNAADPDYRLIGCDAVVAIEMIEHMLPHDLERMVHTVFGFVKPWVAIFTTPNADFNVLFKSMEKNGLRRWDHFFEWTREQFHDWCSNIVARYPQYTVMCKGVGPGPPGTLHYGCCSQLALFINKDYHKQQDLNPNSLALVENVPSANAIGEMITDWESPRSNSDNNVICRANDSMTRLDEILYSAKQSCMTILITPSFSYETLEYRDNYSQCNLDMEIKRNFLMFNDEDMCFTVIIPRRKLDNRVYEMEDVSCRLNCTNYQVKKFSKTTQNLMAKNKIDSLVHTREVVNEIRHLTNMLNFNKENVPNGLNGHIWQNINWGDDAPYWNQYYKIVRDYNYPFETKSEESRILELISDEINRLIDSQYDEEYAVDVNKLEIPIQHLMDVVSHITTDVVKVKDLLDWNGYEIVDDVVIHSRLVVDNTSVPSQEDEWPDNDSVSDWDTSDIRSTTISDGSTIVPDYHGRTLRRALDKKVRKLRTMMSTDEVITTELDRVVCRLMKLALHSSKSKQTPPPTRWMQCKLLDLLTLTEKAIARRKKSYLESFPLKAIDFDKLDTGQVLSKIKDDTTVVQIVDKYQKLIQLSENIECNKKRLHEEYCSILEVQNLCDDDLINDDIPKELDLNNYLKNLKQPESELQEKPFENNLQRVKAWAEDTQISPYLGRTDISTMSPTERSFSRDSLHKNKRYKKTHVKHTVGEDLGPSKENDDKYKMKHGSKEKASKTRGIKKVIYKKSSSSSFVKKQSKNIPEKFGKNVKPKRKIIKEHKKLQSTSSKPIPGSIIELCHPELASQKKVKEYGYSKADSRKFCVNQPNYSNVATTEESLLIDIVMDEMEETIALRRTIGTDAGIDPMVFEQETAIENVVNITEDNSFYNNTHITSENVQSQTIFLNDINEPSTSKGVRHVSMDVQCGPDATSAYAVLSPANSVTRMPKIFTTGIKIEDSLTNLTTSINSNCGTSTNYDDRGFGPTCPRMRSPDMFTKGIKIGESSDNLTKNKNSATSINGNEAFRSISPRLNSNFCVKGLKMADFEKPMDFGSSMEDKFVPEQSNNIYKKEISRRHSNITKTISDFRKSSEDTKTSGLLNRTKSPSYAKAIQAEKFITNTTTKRSTYSSTSPEKPVEYNRRIKFVTGIKAGDSLTDLRTTTFDYGTSIDFNNKNCRTATPTTTPSRKYIVIKKSDSLIDLRSKNSGDIGISTDDRRKSPRRKTCGIMINDSDLYIGNRVDCASRACVSDVQTPYMIPRYFSSSTETKLIKPISSGIKTEDSGSEFYGSCYSPKSAHFTNSSKNISDCLMKQSSVSTEVGVENKGSSTKQVRPKLSCGVVHIHSYKDKQISEDIVYQGEWQRQKPKGGARKRIYNPIVAKKVTDVNVKKKKSISKHDIQTKEPEKLEFPQRKPVQLRRPSVVKVKQEVRNKTEPAKKSPSKRDYLTKTSRSNRSVTKVASKVTMSSASAKNTKMIRAVNKRPVLQQNTVKEGENMEQCPFKSYIPLYLTRRKNILDKKNLSQKCDIEKKNRNQASDFVPNVKVNKNKSNECLKTAVPDTKLDKIEKDLIKFTEEPRDNVSYIVFRNEIENVHKIASDCQPADKENVRKRNGGSKRSVSPLSQTSSTCSTSDSIATVRAVSTRSKINFKRHSTSSNKSSLVNSESESNVTPRNRKLTKRSKGAKTGDEKNQDNKENIPESSKKFPDMESVKTVKSAFMGRNSNVFMAQFAQDSSLAVNTLSKHKSQTGNKSNIKIPAVEDSNDEKKRLRVGNVSLLLDEPNEIKVDKNEEDSPNISNVFVVLGHEGQTVVLENVSQQAVTDHNARETVVKNIIHDFAKNRSSNYVVENTESTISTAMRRIVEDTLGFIGNSSICNTDYDSETYYSSYESVIGEKLDETMDMSFSSKFKLDESFSSGSFETVTTKDKLNSLFKSVENAFNRSFDSNSGEESNSTPRPLNVDLVTNKSRTSTSKFPDYYLVNNELKNVHKSPETVNGSSIRDIFERKDTPIAQVPPGSLAAQAFSGFSMNAECLVDDQPDYVNLIDSETGSLALDITRQVTSEELFISGRSSASYESCLIEEDAVVPNWLFNMINQQAMAEEEAQQLIGPMPEMPLAEPLFDVNGNVVEPGIGAGAGAGDGRGMHSDHSQDSSGRGTSLSSSETSSEQPSEAILMDPSTFTAQFEMIHEPISSSIGATTLVSPIVSPEARCGASEANDAGSLSTSHNAQRTNHPNPLLAASDVDADVSSLDTDVPDSSDN